MDPVMDEERISSYVQDSIDNCKHEIYENKTYSVCDRSEKLAYKAMIKRMFKQGDWDKPHTRIEISIGETVNVEIKNSQIYIYGEYIKMCRNMGQSYLKIRGKPLCERNVSDFCSQVRSFFSAKNVVFSAAGREDIDVRMVGGRPFILEVNFPEKNLFFEEMELVLHEGLSIINFRHVSKACKDTILFGERAAKKIYHAFLCSKKALKLQERYDVGQRTPLRVLHSRGNITRQKEVCIIEWDSKIIGEWFYYLIKLETSAGTYVKEFVNGDFGRTFPSLSVEDNYCDLLELDVLEVEKRDVDPFTLKKIALHTINIGMCTNI